VAPRGRDLTAREANTLTRAWAARRSPGAMLDVARAVVSLHDRGVSYARIAECLGVHKSRVGQLAATGRRVTK
jgi:DNA-directed RNA polymerase specialized sigma24 family protein